MNIQREILDIPDLTEEQKTSMFSLMCRYYNNTFRENFDRDLAEKNWVLMLLDEAGKDIVGFSTQMVFPFNYHGKELRILFSGDTIIQREHWGSMALSLIFGELMLKLLNEFEGYELYWLLISKGLRTYKYLPAFYLEYYPRYGVPTPKEIQELMHALGEYKFPGSYDRQKGIVEANPHAQYLKKEYQPPAKSNKEHEMYYYEMNPGYDKGDELLCLTKLSMDNINPFIKRLISKYL